MGSSDTGALSLTNLFLQNSEASISVFETFTTADSPKRRSHWPEKWILQN
jgi:hypothetical protein